MRQQGLLWFQKLTKTVASIYFHLGCPLDSLKAFSSLFALSYEDVSSSWTVV